MPTISEAWNIAVRHHQRGELVQAEGIYRQIVAAMPHHADAWHMLGVAMHQQGRNADAVEAIGRAITVNGGQWTYYNHLGAAYAGLSALDRAEASFRQALALCQTDSQTFYNLALVLGMRGKTAEAIDDYRKAIALSPQLAEAHFNLGNLLRDNDDLPGAEASYRAAAAAQPNYARALASLASVCTRQNKLEAADAAWRAAREIHREAVTRNPQDVKSLTGLGAALQGLGELAEAKQCYARALAVAPHAVAARYNMGSALLTEGNFLAAEGYFRSLINEGTEKQDAYFHLGQCLQFEGHFDEAIQYYDRAIELKPSEAEFHYYRAVTRLTRGQLALGWPEYEWRLKTRYAGPTYRQPRWHGEPLDGQGIVVYAEWGLGDTVQFVRYLPMLAERGGNIFLAVQPGLIPLLEASGFKQVIPWRDDELPQCQWQVPLLSLPGIFGTTLENIPARIPYLAARPERVEKWAERLRAWPGFKVGIHWHGSKAWATDLRSIPLAEFEPLAALPGVTLISLQKNDGTKQLVELGDRLPLVDFGDELDAAGGAFMDTAAIMKHLDLVITCDTSTAHVAGALGVPVWVVLPRASEWRWMWDRSDSPWYPTMRLFRQRKFAEWGPVFAEIAAELKKTASIA